MTGGYKYTFRLTAALACLSSLVQANTPLRIETEREEARVLREFQAATFSDGYLSDIVERIARAAHRPLTVQVRVRTVVAHRPFVYGLGNGALFVSTGLLARLENDSQVAGVLAPEIVDTMYVSPAGTVRRRGVRNETIAALWVRRAGFDESQCLAAVRRLRRLLAEEDAFDAGALASKAGLDLRETLVRRGLAAPDLKAPQTVRIADDPQRLREIAHRYSLIIADSYVDRHRYQSFTALIDRIEREFGADTRSICLRAQHQRSVGMGDAGVIIQAFHRCAAAPDAPVSSQLDLARLYRSAGESSAAIRHFEEYLKRAPNAVDAPIVQSYIEELRGKHP